MKVSGVATVRRLPTSQIVNLTIELVRPAGISFPYPADALLQSNMATEQGRDGPQLELMTLPEVAILLRTSKTSIYRLVESRRLPFFRLGGSLRFERKDVKAFLLARHVPAIKSL